MTVTKDAISIARTIRLGFFKSVRAANSGFSPCKRRGFSDDGGTNDEESIVHVLSMFLAVYLTPRTRSSASDGTESNIGHRTLIIQYSRFERHALSRAKF